MAGAPQPPAILSFEDARHLVERHAAGIASAEPRKRSICWQVAGRVLAREVVADRDFPPFRRAMRDGYRGSGGGFGALPATLKSWGKSRQARLPKIYSAKLGSGQAAAIMTGAPAPEWRRCGGDGRVHISSADQVTITRGVAAATTSFRRTPKQGTGQRCWSREHASTMRLSAWPPQWGLSP